MINIFHISNNHSAMNTTLNKFVNLMTVTNIIGSIIAICSVTGAVSMYNSEKPLPILTVKHKTIYEDTWVDVHIDKGTNGSLRDLKYKHNNLDRMYSRGYTVGSFQTCGYAGKNPVLELINYNKSYDDFIADCKACKVSTDISVDGSESKNVPWATNTVTN